MRGRSPFLLPILLALSLPSLRGQGPALPELPQLNVSNFFPAVREQVQRAYEAAQAQPRSALASGELGMILDTYETYESAAICYQRARLLEPKSFQWAYYLGWVQAAQGRYADAETTLREALRLNPDYLPAQLKLAETLLAAGKWEEGARIYGALAQEYPDLPIAHYGLGRIHSARRDETAAVESLRKACELFPPYGAAHYALALAYRKLGAREKVQENFKLYEQNKISVPGVEDPLRNAVADLNLGPLGHMRRGVTLDEAGKTEEAIAEQKKALEADPKLVQVHINLIALYGRLNQVEEAEQHYRAAVSLNPNQAEAYYNYGVLLLRQGKNPEAERAFRQVLQINPYYAEAHNNLGVLLEQQGGLDEALVHFQDAIANRPSFRLAHFHAGRILVNQGHYDEAIQDFLKTLEPEDESTPRYLYALGATYARAGNRASALQYLRQARDKAAARGQTELRKSIDRDLATLEEAPPKQ